MESMICPKCGEEEGHLKGCSFAGCPECGSPVGHDTGCSLGAEQSEASDDSPEAIERRLSADVDGVPAAVVISSVKADAAEPARRGRKKSSSVTRRPPPHVTEEQVLVLQRAINDRIIFGFKQPLTDGITLCSAEYMGTDGVMQEPVVLGCSALVAFMAEKHNVCPTCHTDKKDREHLFCVAHMALYLDGKYVEIEQELPFEPKQEAFTLNGATGEPL